MATYRGIIGVNGEREVTVDGKKLKLMDLGAGLLHSPSGFAWGYYGSGPAELARHILMHFFDERPTRYEVKTGLYRAARLYQSFKEEVVGGWPQESDWTITSDEIRQWIQQHKGDNPWQTMDGS